jgi:succinate-acetate transporter protein
MDVADIIFIALTLAFFALCVAYVRGLDRIVRAAEEADEVHEVAA